MSRRLRRGLFFSCVIFHRQADGPDWVDSPQHEVVQGLASFYITLPSSVAFSSLA